MTDGSLVTIYQFTIVNISPKKRIISSIRFEFNTIKNCTYGPPGRHVNNTPLDFGETLSYELYATDFYIIHELGNAKKFRIVVRDTIEKKYISRWIKFR